MVLHHSPVHQAIPHKKEVFLDLTEAAVEVEVLTLVRHLWSQSLCMILRLKGRHLKSHGLHHVKHTPISREAK